ncbi:lytic transglycosylase domain-containing protein [Arthrobacter castelli]|uniref:lytic transglycosylase domain-containing protein n=1 Tax=Arthrobacter castelli TaxID=271431 RepID=UPI00040C1746|nr:lytic transglycosylase domain-containing protein [Arthrobacter castelli]
MSPQRQLTNDQPTSSNTVSGSGTQRSRKFGSAISTAAIPTVVLSSLALAQPAQASPSVTVPKSLPSGVANAATAVGPAQGVITPSSLVATKVPSATTTSSKAPSSYTVQSGDTITSIAAQHGKSVSEVLEINGLQMRSIIYPGQKITLESNGSHSASKQQRHNENVPASNNNGASKGSSSSYTVKAGDTISSIAAQHDKSINEVLEANGLNMGSVIYPGQEIKLSGSTITTQANDHKVIGQSGSKQEKTSGSYTVKAGDTISSIAAQHGKSISEVLEANGLNMGSVIHPGQKIKLSGANVTTQANDRKLIDQSGSKKGEPSGKYTVKSGDTLGSIAARHGVSLSSLLKANSLNLGSVIHPGNKLAIPGQGSQDSGKESKPKNLVPNTFLHYTYPKHVVAKANQNKAALLEAPAPSQAEIKDMIVQTARSMGVPPSLALAHAYQESGFNHRAVSPANAIGTMQVIPASGEWASELVGRQLNLLDPADNITAGVAIIDALLRTTDSRSKAIGSYYQGQAAVEKHGLYDDTKNYVKSVKALEKQFS